MKYKKRSNQADTLFMDIISQCVFHWRSHSQTVDLNAT